MNPTHIDIAMMLLIFGGVSLSVLTTRKWTVLYVSNAVIFFRERAKDNSV